ncbi:MAG: PilZ domain-containing protein [Acidobacteriota bacterium]
MDSNDAAFSPSRQATRAPVNLLVRLEMEGPHGRTLEARCNNISIGGMFVLSDVVAESGQQLRFVLVVGEGGVVHGLAVVVWCPPASERRPAGLGFKFRYLEQRDRQLIFKLVSRHIKERLASRPATSPPPAPSGPTPTLLTPPDSPSGPPAFAVAPPPVSSAAEVPPAAPPPAPAFSASSTHQTTPSIAPPPSPAPPPPAPPPAPRDQQSQAPAFSVPSSPASGPPTPAPEPRPRAVPAVTLPLPVATPIEAADGPPAAPVGQQSLEGLFGAEPAAGGLDPRRPSSSPSPLGDRPPSMGFKDLGTSAEPEMAYREAAPAAQSGPTILQDDVGDSLFGDPVDEPLSLGPDDTGYADYLGDSHF